jgi:uroporphyrinogen-III synthase
MTGIDFKALRGVRVAVTRPQDGADALSEELLRQGAEVLPIPLIAIVPVPDDSALRRAAAEVAGYDWVVFTSANAVRYLADAIAAAGDPGGTAGPPTRVAAVGPGTARVVAEILGWRVDATPGDHVGDALPAAMQAIGSLSGARVLWPRALGAREVVPRLLREAGAVLDAPAAYRTVELPDNARSLVAMLERGEVDAVTLTSPSAVRCLAAAHPPSATAVFAVIGPVTAAAARRCGLPVHVTPDTHTIPALVEALVVRLGSTLR